MTTPDIDTKALRELRDDACKLDGHSLMEVLHAQQKYERAIINAAPALLDLADRAQEQAKEIEELRGDSEKWRTAARVLCGAHVGLPQSACPVCERDALNAEVAWIDAVLARRPALDKPTRAANIEHAINVARQADELRAKLSASEREAERLRADVAKVCDDWVHGDTHTTDWLLSRLMPIAQRGFALRGEEAPRE